MTSAKPPRQNQSQNIGINALVFKNPVTGVAKRILNLYSPHQYVKQSLVPTALEIYFFSPHPFTPATLAQFKQYGIDFNHPPATNPINQIPSYRYHLIITRGGWLRRWLANIPMGRETVEWWWTHITIPGLLKKYNIALYDAQWGGGLPTRYPWFLFKWLGSLNRPHFFLTIHDLIPLKFSEKSLSSIHSQDSKKKKYLALFSLYLWKYFKSIKEYLEQQLFCLRVKANLQIADTVVTITPAVEEDLKQFFPKIFSSSWQNKIVVCPNGVGHISNINKGNKDIHKPTNPKPAYLNVVAKQILSKQVLPNPYVFYIGGFNPRKNLPLLIVALDDAYKIINSENSRTLKIKLEKKNESLGFPGSLGLVLAGKLNRYFREKLIPLLAKVDYPVVALGYVDDHDLTYYYQHSAGLCYPSLAEGFGMPPLEGLQAGTRIIIDQELPINKPPKNHNHPNTDYSMVVEWLAGKDRTAHTALSSTKKWWQEKVIALNLTSGNPMARSELTKALVDITLKSIKAEKRKSSPQVSPLAGATSPLHWHSLRADYHSLLISKINKLNR